MALTLTDFGSGIKEYYWGTNGTDYKSNAYKSAYSSGYKSTYTASVTVTADGTYYLTAVDRNDNPSATVQVTFNKTLFNANGGTVSPSYSVNPNNAVLDMTTLTAKRTGYYGGDYINNSGKSNDWRTGTSSLTRITSYTVTENDTLYAAWNASEYAVTIEHYYMDTSGNYPDSPSDSETRQIYYDTVLVHGNLKNEPAGLTYDEEKTTRENGGRTQTEVTGETVIRLYYDRKLCTVTYDYQTNGGTSVEKAVMQVYYGADADLSVKAYKNGFVHAGWNTDSEVRTGFAQYTVTGNVTLYAIYRKDVTVTFVDFAGTVTEMVVLYNRQEYELIDASEITPYAQWENVSGIKTEGYSSKADITADGAVQCEVESGQKNLRVSESITYYAVCSAEVTLSYEVNGGTENDTTKPVTKTVYCNAAAPQEVKGFALQLGEATKPEYGEEGYIHSYTFAIWAENGEDSEIVYPSNAEYVLTQNTVMYAIWNEHIEAITYTVAYDGNKGIAVTGVPDAITVRYDEVFAISEMIPERAGFAFINWNTRADGTGMVFESGQETKNLTTINNGTVKLYAQWREKRHVLVRASSSRYKAVIMKRIPGDDRWYNAFGQLTLDEIGNYPDEKCVQVWHIDNRGNITQVK